MNKVEPVACTPPPPERRHHPSFYRRTLPDSQVDFTSTVGKRLFHEALADGTAEAFFPLIANLHTQAEPSWCGLGSLVTVLNALQIDPGRTWKGPWRWFGEELLDCCTSIEQATSDGLTLAELSTLARCNGAHVDLHHATEGSEAAFRRALDQAARANESGLIAGYHRGPMEQTGAGHYSPIGAVHSDSDQVLILDVARFKYPPHWASISQLWEAVQTVDEASGKPRGWMVLRASGASPCQADIEQLCKRLEAAGVVVPTRPPYSPGCPTEFECSTARSVEGPHRSRGRDRRRCP